MRKQILVIGGTRYFGKLLVGGLLRDGHDVTIATRGLAADGFGGAVRRVRVDRRDGAALRAAFAGGRGFDVVYDQVCYSPLDASAAALAFGGKVGRYVMASTIEVYGRLRGVLGRPFREGDVDLAGERVDMGYPWHDPALAESSYGAGKLQAEAFLHQGGGLPAVFVRIGHVLGGPEDFTGRLSNYVARAAERRPLCYSAGAGRSSFISAAGAAAFLRWAGGGEFLGPINAASHGRWSALDLHARASGALGVPFEARAVRSAVAPSELSPFDYPAPYAVDTERARSLGYSFDHISEWFDGLVRQHAPPPEMSARPGA